MTAKRLEAKHEATIRQWGAESVGSGLTFWDDRKDIAMLLAHHDKWSRLKRWQQREARAAYDRGQEIGRWQAGLSYARALGKKDRAGGLLRLDAVSADRIAQHAMGVGWEKLSEQQQQLLYESWKGN